jgi:galactitol-specific phosphotransferase system IIB component
MAQKCMPKREAELPQMPDSLRGHAAFAADRLQKMGMEISRAMRKHQLKLADRQCRMSELSNRVQKLLIMLCTAMHAAQQNDEIVEMAAAVMCQEMKDELEGRRHSDQHYRQITKLGEAIADGKFESIAGVTADEILMPYEA